VSTRNTVRLPIAVLKLATEPTHQLKPMVARIQLPTMSSEPALAHRVSGFSAGPKRTRAVGPKLLRPR
jgi:hypothetical protein